MRTLPALLAAALPLAACGGLGAGANPEFTPVVYPAPLVGAMQSVNPEPPQPVFSANSLWKSGARAFFKDQRATRVGDILTVSIQIDDSAEMATQSGRVRNNRMSGGVTDMLGLESSLGRILPGGFDPSTAIGFNGQSTSSGQGNLTRSEQINLTIAAVVTQVLPNGNMIIQGRQEVRANNELRELTVAGIIRPEDITSANTIRHEQIAEARISYGGRGALSRTQQVPSGQAVLERITPF